MAVGDIFKNPTVRNTAIGIGVAILVPIAARVLTPFVRPLARSTLKIGLVTFEKGRETAAEYREIFEDMVAEVREELRAEHEIGGVEDQAAHPLPPEEPTDPEPR